MSTPINMHTAQARHLCSAVIETAISDYRYHVRDGNIAGRRLTRKPIIKIRDGYRHQGSDAGQVLHFLSQKGLMDVYISLAGLDIDPKMIRERLGIGGAA